MFMPLYVVYDTSIWTEFGYTVQRYIGNSTITGIKILMPIVGISLVAFLIKRILGVGK